MAPQWNPAPNAENTTGPAAGFSRDHSAAAMSMDADEVLPYRATFEYTRSPGTPSDFATRISRF